MKLARGDQSEIRVKSTWPDGDTSFLQEALAIRNRVFVQEQGFSVEQEYDSNDELESIVNHQCIHIIATTTSHVGDHNGGSGDGLTEVGCGTMRVRRICPPTSTQATTAVTMAEQQPQKQNRVMRWKLERVCVLPEHRSKGIARAMINHAMEHIVSTQFRSALDSQSVDSLLVYLHSQVPVVPLYRSCGFTEEGDVFMEDGCPHQKMVNHK